MPRDAGHFFVERQKLGARLHLKASRADGSEGADPDKQAGAGGSGFLSHVKPNSLLFALSRGARAFSEIGRVFPVALLPAGLRTFRPSSEAGRPRALEQIEYRAKSAEGTVRHPFFKGLREDLWKRGR
jgi:hypothetical protein